MNMTQSDHGTEPRRTRILNGMRRFSVLASLAVILMSGLAASNATEGRPHAARWMPGLHQVEKPTVREWPVTVTYVERLTGTRFYYELSNGAAWVADRPRACSHAPRPFRCWEAAGQAGFDVTSPMTPLP